MMCGAESANDCLFVPLANTAWAPVSPASAAPIYWESEDCSNRRIVATTANFLHAIDAFFVASHDSKCRALEPMS
jgi:hypothetical protein